MPQFKSHGSCFDCRANCKDQDPCTQGANVNQCAPCAALSEEQWTHLRENFAKRSAYRNHMGSQENSFEELDADKPAFTSEDLSRVDDTILDLEPEHSGSTAPATSISPLTSLPAPLPGSSQDIPATSVLSSPGPVPSPHGEASAFFKAPTPVPQMVMDWMASLSFPQPQRISSLMVPQTPRTQMIKSHLEQQNFELMKDLQQKNQEQMRDISAELQTGL